MKKTLLLFFVLIFSCSPGIKDSSISELQQIQIVNRQSIKQVYTLFEKLDKNVSKKTPMLAFEEFARVLSLVHKVDNYYCLEPITSLVYHQWFIENVSESLNAKDKKLFQENVDILLREIKEGNG